MSHVDNIIAFQGETMLLAWAESNTRGRTVTFQLAEEGEEHPFRHFTVKTGKRAGQRFAMVLVQIDDDEKPVERKPSQVAFLYCQDERFWGWCNDNSFVTVDSEESAKQYMLELLNTAAGTGVRAAPVTSRSQLDTRPTVRAAFEMLIEKPFGEYMKAAVGAVL